MFVFWVLGLSDHPSCCWCPRSRGSNREERRSDVCDGRSARPGVCGLASCRYQQLVVKITLLSANKYLTFINNSGEEEGGGRKRKKSTKHVIELSGSRV